MGNISREVFPMSRQSLVTTDSTEVNKISKHQPVVPHLKKFLISLSFLHILSMGLVCAGGSGICIALGIRKSQLKEEEKTSGKTAP